MSFTKILLPDRDEDFTADPAELFFDLSFVFAFSRLVYYLVHQPDWAGVGEASLLFALIWLPWTQFTWSANAVAGNSRPVRGLFMLATVASVPMSASITTAFGDGGPAFGLAVAVILSMALFTMLAGVANEAELRRSVIQYSIPNIVAMVFIVSGGFIDGDARTWCWLIAIATVLAGTVKAGSGEWVVRPGHFAERHGLIVIVALGEVIVAVALPLVESLEDGAGLSAMSMVALVASGALATLLWWGYFDRANPALEHRHLESTDTNERGRFARDVYTYADFPLIAGIIVTAAATEEVTLHPSEPLPGAFRAMLLAGLVLYLGAVVIAIFRAYRAAALERLAAIAALGIIVAFGSSIDAIVLLILVDFVLLTALVVEHWRVEVAHRTSEDL